MTLLHPWWLLLAPVPLVWLALEWRRAGAARKRLTLALKALMLVCVILALADPVLDLRETKVAVAALVDTSESVTADDLSTASRYIADLQSRRGRHWLRVIPFAGSVRPLDAAETRPGGMLVHTAGDSGRATDLEVAIRDAAASLPAGLQPRLLLITDGNENRGSAARAAWQAQQLRIPVDTLPLASRTRPPLRLDAVVFPSVAFTGERFPIDLVVDSPARASAAVEISAEGRQLGSTRVDLEPGPNQVHVQAALNSTGAILVSGSLDAGPALGELRFDQAVTLRRPRVLYVSRDPAQAETNLLRTLASAQFDVDHLGALPPGPLEHYQVIVFNNWDYRGIPLPFKRQLEAFVKQGGGLLLIGGENNIYVESRKEEDELDRALPARLAPPRTPEGTAVVLIIDKSSSMEGRKMELARVAAIGVIDNLRPIDLVGVLIFDNSFQWAVPIRKAEDRSLIRRLVSGITPDGGTQIAPALAEAYKRIVTQKAAFKHIVLLTDGISEEGDSMVLAHDAAMQHVTISTVGLGQDVNRAYLEKVAVAAQGKSYFLNEPAGLEQILLKDVMEHTGTTTVEKPFRPEVARKSDLLSGVAMETAPPLKGYVRFIAKPTADTILKVDGKDPLLARWQYGLGRSAVFASDAKARWAERWIGWPGYDRFWTNLFRDLLPHARGGEATAEFDTATSRLVVDYRLAGQTATPPQNIPDIFVLGPAGFRRPVPVRKVAEGAWRGEVELGSRRGLFRIRPLADSSAFPEVGYYRREEELDDYGSNDALLKQIAAFTGGRFRPAPEQVFRSGDRGVPASLRLWPLLLALALAANLAELILRKWKKRASAAVAVAAAAQV